MTKAATFFRRFFSRLFPAREQAVPRWVQEELAFSEATVQSIARRGRKAGRRP